MFKVAWRCGMGVDSFRSPAKAGFVCVKAAATAAELRCGISETLCNIKPTGY
jgi:hypothetical protein